MRLEKKPGQRNRYRDAFLPCIVAAFALLCLSACSVEKKYDAMPGLRDLRPTGAEGQACYQHCSMGSMDCNHMCPTGSADCKVECTHETKRCLASCPELAPIKPQTK